MGLLLGIIIIILLIKNNKNRTNNNHWNTPNYQDRNFDKKYTNYSTKTTKEPTFEEWRKTYQPEQATTSQTEPVDKQTKTTSINFRESYQAKRIFTNNEWQNYKALKSIADIRNYIICPKVRLWDIIEPRHGTENWTILKNKIQSKHVDFVICDQYMNIIAIIELDDNSHYQAKRLERDEFIDLILRSVGYKVIHTKYITPDILDSV